jgi:hypothetical protein
MRSGGRSLPATSEEIGLYASEEIGLRVRVSIAGDPMIFAGP